MRNRGRAGGGLSFRTRLDAAVPSPHPALDVPARRAALLLAYAAVALTLFEYVFSPAFFRARFPGFATELNGLYPHLWWAAGTIALYLPMPMLWIRFGFKQSLRDYGWTLRIARKHWWIYGGILCVMAPIVVVAASQPSFLAVYPFYRGAASAPLGAVIAWELAYLTQFIALEFFFRGVLAIGLGQSMGRLAVWVAALPYCMIHYHKPLPEALSAILAGLILGELAQRTRSIAGGVLAHSSVAFTMDMLALSRR